MKKYLPLVVTLLLTLTSAAFAQDATKPTPEASPKPKPTISRAQIQRNLMRNEKALWEAWKNKDVKPFKTWIAANAVGIGEMGVQGKADLLKDIVAAPCEIKSFELSEFKFHWIDNDAVVVTYKGAADGTCAGNALPSVWASSTWVSHGGRWLAMTHQETATH